MALHITKTSLWYDRRGGWRPPRLSIIPQKQTYPHKRKRRELITMSNLPINSIEIANRKRHLGDIEQLAKSISELGLLNPITITKDGTLIAGLHRLEACRSLGWTEIPVTIIELGELQTELAEIDENLVRSELSQLDESLQLATAQRNIRGAMSRNKKW